MSQAGWEFSGLLTQGIFQVRTLESKPLRTIQDELGYALHKKGGASIEYWRKGHVPSKLVDLEKLGSELVKRGRLDRPWLENFLHKGGHPAAQQICDELFPPLINALNANQGNFRLPESYVPEPASSLPAGSVMPLNRYHNFTGRTADLQSIARKLNGGKDTTISQIETAAASGLGGIGKTQLASEFVHRYGPYFTGGVFWLSFADEKAIPAMIAECGGKGAMDLGPDYEKQPLHDRIKLVQAAWQKSIPRLLVFDNCEDPALLTRWRPATGGCRILITSRRGDWEEALGIDTLLLDVFSRSESVALLKRLYPTGNGSIFDAIADELGDLPLALHLAGSYLYRYRRVLTPADYLNELRKPDLLQHPSMHASGQSPTGHIQNIGKTFALSYDRLDLNSEKDVLAQKLLVHIAHFAPGEPIWYELLIKTLRLSPDDPEAALQADEAFGRLIELGLIETRDDKKLKMHRLIAEFVKGMAPDQLKATQKAVEDVVFEETASYNRLGRPIPLLAWQYHLLSVVDIAHAREDAQGARLCSELGQHLFQVGDYDGARPYYEKALSIQRKLYGKSHLDIADSLNRLGYLLHAQGKSEEALSHFKQALTIQNELLGGEDLAVARTLNYIGQTYYAQGDIFAAKTQFERALQISLRVVGDEHSLSAEYINNVGMCLMALNALEEALSHLLRALAINENRLGLEHRDTAMGCNNIALVLSKMGRFGEARPYGERALAVRRKILGEDHPDTGQSLRILGDILVEQADLAGAETCFEQAIQIYRKAYPDGRHPRVGLCLTSLGRLKYRQGALEEAYQFLAQALNIQQSFPSEKNVDKAVTLLCLGQVLTAQGERLQARKLLRQARLIYQAAPGNYRREVEQIRKDLSAM